MSFRAEHKWKSYWAKTPLNAGVPGGEASRRAGGAPVAGKPSGNTQEETVRAPWETTLLPLSARVHTGLLSLKT